MSVLLHCAVRLPVRVGFSQKRVCSVTLTRRAQRQMLPASLARQLCRYFNGDNVSFRVPLDLSAGTEFQRNVWRALQTIPFGQTRTYAWVARKIGKPGAVRAVGAACGANPVPVIIPCHRVLRSDGSLGGFSAGLDWKKRLLELEHRR